MQYSRAAEIRSIRKKLSTEAREGFRIAEFIKYECIMVCVKEERQKSRFRSSKLTNGLLMQSFHEMHGQITG